MKTVPSNVAMAVARRVFADLDAANWDSLSPSEKSQQYSKWLADPEVGGRLGRFLPPDRARVWLKDGPIKERAKAQAGLGKYAGSATGESQVEAILARALGAEWIRQSRTLRSKPLRMDVRHVGTDESRTVSWGPSRDFKHLVWASLVARSNGDMNQWHLVVVGSIARPVGKQERKLQERISERVGVFLSHIELS